MIHLDTQNWWYQYFWTHLFFVFFGQSNRLLSGKWVIWNRFTIYILREFPILIFNRLIRNLILHESWHQIEGFSFELIWIQRTKTFILTLTLKVRKNRNSSNSQVPIEIFRNWAENWRYWNFLIWNTFTFLQWGHPMCIKIQCRNKTEKLEKLKSIEKHYFKFYIWDDPFFNWISMTPNDNQVCLAISQKNIQQKTYFKRINLMESAGPY